MMQTMRTAFRPASTLRLLALAMLALVLAMRAGPLCEGARAAPLPAVQMADCAEHGTPAPMHAPVPAAPGAPGALDLACMAPCAVIAPEFAQPAPAALAAALPAPAPDQPLHGIATLPDTPPPRWA